MAPGVIGYWPFLVDELLYSIFSQSCCVFSGCCYLVGFPNGGGWNLLCLDESRCAQYREMLLLISCQRAEHQHMSSHHKPFFCLRLPPSATNMETNISFSCLNALVYSSSTPLPPPVITGFPIITYIHITFSMIINPHTHDGGYLFTHSFIPQKPKSQLRRGNFKIFNISSRGKKIQKVSKSLQKGFFGAAVRIH